MIILDVREREEFEAEHIPNAISCPLSQFDFMAPGILKNIKKEGDILIMCLSGKRSHMALRELAKIDSHQHSFKVFEGGITEWKKQGHPVVGQGGVFSIMRQVQIVASTLIFIAFIGFKFFSSAFIYLALFVGFGLALAGFTGICPMVYILQKMPWNNKKNWLL